MIMINTQKRTRIFALPEFEEKELAGVPVANGLPEGVYRLTTSTNEVPTDKFAALHAHPDFQRAISQGHILLVGKNELVRKVPMVAGKISVVHQKKVKKAGVGIIYESQEPVEEPAKVIKPDFLNEIKGWPKNLKALRNLLGYENEQDAMAIAEYTVDMECLNLWLKAEKKAPQDDQRPGVIETLEETIKKVKAFDLRVTKARAGDNEDEA